jgi:hypothetical protein
MNKKLIAALDRSIADAHKICRRHCSNPSINTKAYEAAMRLSRTLEEIKQKEQGK